MRTFTLDTNCIIDLDEGRIGAPAVRRLAAHHRSGTADVAIAASSASERQQAGTFLSSFADFELRLAKLGLADLPVLLPLMRWDMGFWDRGVWASDEEAERERKIHNTMFPSSPSESAAYAAANNADPEDLTSKEYAKWRNQILDAQAYWTHIFNKRDIFVTSDREFRRFEGDPQYPSVAVASPDDAVRRFT